MPLRQSKEIIEVVLSDGKVRQLQSMTTTTFWSPEGKPITATEFLKSLYGTIPDLFQSEEDLKTQWSTPATRKSLLGKLEEKGYTKEQLSEFQKILSAENSDIYDVLSYVAYQSEILEREQRAAKMREHFKELNANHQEFLEFVLNQYILNGVYELDDEKLGTFLQLKYKTIADAKPILGDLKTIRNNFIEYQKYLYV